MEEKKSVKISLGTVICLFIILFLLIVLGVTYYLGFIKKKKEDENTNIVQTNIIQESLTETNINENQETKETYEQKSEDISAIYQIQPDRDLLDESYFDMSNYGDENITFKDDGTFSAYVGWGMVVAGTYKEENNIINCTVDSFFGDNSPEQRISTYISFKRINDSTIEIVDVEETYKIKVVDLVNKTLTDEEKDMPFHPFVKGIRFVKYEDILSSSEIQTILGEGDIFCIENIEKDGDEYIITAYMLEHKTRVITNAEYEKLLNGGEIEFRNLKWKTNDNSQIDIQNGIVIHSGEKLLAVFYDKQKEEATFENIAGAKVGGLSDYSENPIKFKVSKDILIGGMIWTKFKYDNNGKVIVYQDGEEITNFVSMTFDELLDKAKTRTGTYQECKALVKNGKVDVIQIMED